MSSLYLECHSWTLAQIVSKIRNSYLSISVLRMHQIRSKKIPLGFGGHMYSPPQLLNSQFSAPLLQTSSYTTAVSYSYQKGDPWVLNKLLISTIRGLKHNQINIFPDSYLLICMHSTTEELLALHANPTVLIIIYGISSLSSIWNFVTVLDAYQNRCYSYKHCSSD